MLDMKKQQQDPCYEESLKDFRELCDIYLKELGYKDINEIKGKASLDFYDEIERRQRELKKERSAEYLTMDELDKKYEIDTREEDEKKYQAFLEVEEAFMKQKGYTDIRQIERMSIEWEEYVNREMEKKGFHYGLYD